MKTKVLITLILLTFTATAFSQAPQEKQVTVFGAKINYVEAGDPSKPVVLLLHGMGASAGVAWPMTTPALAANYRVLAPDMIGFGKSDKPFINYRVAFYVDFIDRFLTEVKADKVSIVGNSLGGWIAALYAAKYPTKVNKLVLVGSAGYGPPPGFDYGKLAVQMNPSTRDAVRESLKLMFYNSAPLTSDAAVDGFISARSMTNDGYTIQTLIRNLQHADDYFDDEVKALKTPTLLVWGKQDGIVPVIIGEMLKRDIAGSELFIIDKAGHLPQFEQPVEFNKKVSEFLAK
ncbi:MAG TPA: alpha/beta hydrolase [Pyrinomonadaceae bacterium]|nr:alpha/beta hydrolase [Pyrinomonadaceae bacterium]